MRVYKHERRRREPPRASCARATSSASCRCFGTSRAPRARGRLGLHAAALPDRPLSPPARRASRLPAAARAAHPAVRLPPRRQRAARLRRGDPAGGGVGAARLARAGRARARAGGGSAAGRRRAGEAAPDPPVPARLPARRDGLRRRLPGDDLPPLRPRGRHLAHPPGGPHLDRRDDAGRDHARRRGARPRRPLGPRVEEQARRPAAAGGRALGGEPLGRPLPRRRQARARLRPRPRPPQDPARGVPGALERLHVGRRLHGAPGRRAGGADEPCLGQAVPAPAPAAGACSRSGSRSWRPRSSSSCRS